MFTLHLLKSNKIFSTQPHISENCIGLNALGKTNMQGYLSRTVESMEKCMRKKQKQNASTS